ncbi:hypothetical protein NSND_63300 [Nitrospira sp. ND1]|nr:hypothetical protein NSND_63300 [Nitrospira sp. ND1]
MASLTEARLNLRPQRERLPGEGTLTKVPSENRSDDRDHVSRRRGMAYLLNQTSGAHAGATLRITR